MFLKIAQDFAANPDNWNALGKYFTRSSAVYFKYIRKDRHMAVILVHRNIFPNLCFLFVQILRVQCTIITAINVNTLFHVCVHVSVIILPLLHLH